MFIRQISIFIENRPGAVLEITSVLKDAGINIRALSIADTADYGIVRLIVDNPAEAVKALRSRGITVTETNVIAVSVDDKPGGFSKALEALFEGSVTIEYSYAFVSPIGSGATVILRCSDQEKAAKLLSDRGFRLLTQDEVKI